MQAIIIPILFSFLFYKTVKIMESWNIKKEIEENQKRINQIDKEISLIFEKNTNKKSLPYLRTERLRLISMNRDLYRTYNEFASEWKTFIRIVKGEKKK
jgi:hypothetical protein